MMKGLGYVFIPIIVIGIFIFSMTSGLILKKPLLGHDDVLYHVHALKEDVRNEQWKKAENQLKQAKNAWKKVSKRIQVSSEREEMRLISRIFVRVHGFIETKEKGSVLAEIEEIEFLWHELGR